jgi:hypothetical protein
MKTNNIPCILIDQQEQLKLAIWFMEQRYSPVKIHSSELVCSMHDCQCGCKRTVSCRLLFDGWGQFNIPQLLELKNDSGSNLFYRPPIYRWALTEKNQQNNTQVLLITSGNNTEVILLNTNKDSPLCSVLTTEGIVDSVLDLDWFKNKTIEGNQQK